MKVTISKELNNNNYKVMISVSEMQKGNYLEAIKDYGEIPINLGGEVKEGETVLATLSNNYIKITDIEKNPVEQNFYTQQYSTNSKKIADAWAETVVASIKTYVAGMCAKVDDFTETQVYDV